MNELYLNILSTVTTAIILPLIALMGAKFMEFVNSRIKNETAQNLLDNATTIVTNAVKCVFQTYVESLKASGSFSKGCQVEALNMAKLMVIQQLSADTQEFLNETYGSVDAWLTTQIKASINTLKNA